MDEAALIAACNADPVDDTCHLVLADWWDEHGDDRQRARAEWIRLTCSAGRKWRGGVRQTGEPAWIRKNAPRIWPAIAARCNNRVTGPMTIPFMRLLHQQIILPVPRYSKRNANRRAGSTNIRVCASRGVTESVTIPFRDARLLGPIVARDEPHAQLETATASLMWYTPWGGLGPNNIRQQHVTVSAGPFKVFGLLNVWERLTGWQLPNVQYNDGHQHRVYVFKHDDHETMCWGYVSGRINMAFTAWARDNAHTPPPGKPLTEIEDL